MSPLARALSTIGWILIAAYAVAQLHSLLGSNLALAQLASAGSGTTSAPPIDDAPVDVSLWSQERVAKFRDALGIPTAPPIAALRMPRIGIEVPVFKGTDEVTLNRGAGWIAGTALPGSNGNVALAAHRDGFFRALKDAAVDDVIELEANGQVQTYVVRSLTIVDPTNITPLAPTNEPALTLVTCYPFYFVGSAPQRFIVRATPAALADGIAQPSTTTQDPSPGPTSSRSGD